MPAGHTNVSRISGSVNRLWARAASRGLPGGKTPVQMGDAQLAEATFHRPPRSGSDLPPEELRIHAPPAKPEPPSGGLMQAMFPVSM
jgi:hypothetical protein